MRQSYIRLVILQDDDDSQVEQGLFHAAEALWMARLLEEHEEELVRETFCWFNRHLPTPDRFSRSRRSGARKRAISWFKTSAKEFLARMEDLVTVLNEHGYETKRLTTTRPGYVVYEDEYQIVAEVFRN